MLYADDNTDDVFRKAAKNYPLNTGKADWQRMHRILNSEEPGSHKKKIAQRWHQRFISALLFRFGSR